MTPGMTAEEMPSPGRTSSWHGALGQLPGHQAPCPLLPKGKVVVTHRWIVQGDAWRKPRRGAPLAVA